MEFHKFFILYKQFSVSIDNENIYGFLNIFLFKQRKFILNVIYYFFDYK